MEYIQHKEIFGKLNELNITNYSYKLNTSRNEASKLLNLFLFNTQNKPHLIVPKLPTIPDVSKLIKHCWALTPGLMYVMYVLH